MEEEEKKGPPMEKSSFFESQDLSSIKVLDEIIFWYYGCGHWHILKLSRKDIVYALSEMCNQWIIFVPNE